MYGNKEVYLLRVKGKMECMHLNLTLPLIPIPRTNYFEDIALQNAHCTFYINSSFHISKIIVLINNFIIAESCLLVDPLLVNCSMTSI